MFRIVFSRTLKIAIPSRDGVTLPKSIPYLSYFLTSSFSSSSKSSDVKAHSFTVSYLITSCGLSPKSAIVAAKKVRFQNPKKPDSVIAFLRVHGFSDSQISSFVAKRPMFLVASPEKTILPKLEFFYSKGLSKKSIVNSLSSYPFILRRGLNNHIIPFFNLLKRFLSTDERVIHAMASACHCVSSGDHLESAMSNVRLFRDLGFSDANIRSVLLTFPVLVVVNPERLVELVNKAREMGFIPGKWTFLLALRALSSKNFEKKWRRTSKIYEWWGWSEEEIMGAFRYHPSCIEMSEARIEKKLEFLVNEMRYPSKKIAECPVVLLYSFEKRIFPRCSVLRVLLSKGLVEQSNVNLRTLLPYAENIFLNRYVTKYLGKVPLLLSVYEGKVDPKDA